MEQTTNAGTKSFFGHPRGLLVLFSTELWERFSYYGMRALLIFYLTQHFLFSDQKAYLIYGAYTALVYVMPVIGGMLADRYLGARKAVSFGAVLLVLGHFGMAFEGPASVRVEDGVERNHLYLQIFYLSLAFIITGVGFLKANISTIVGALYEQNDPRRDGGFTIFYMGINIGAFTAALLCGWLGQTYGWAYGFGLAGIGMLGGLIVFLHGQHWLEGHAEPPDSHALNKPVFAGLNTERLIYLGAVAGVLVIWQLVQHQKLVGDLLMGFGGLMLLVIIVYSLTQCTPVERDRMITASILIAFSVLFWALFEQAGSSLNLFADRFVNRHFFGWEIPASMFQSLNALFIFTLAPFFSIAWTRMAIKGIEPSTPLKFSLATFLVGLGFLVLVFGAGQANDGKAAMIWLVLIYLLHTMGELCISPVGLSMVTKLSVQRVVGMMMGVWFLATAGANYLAGLIAQVTGGHNADGTALDPLAAGQKVIDVYTHVGWLAVGVAVLIVLISPLLRKGMHGID